MPAEDDGSRDDPLLSDRSWAVSSSPARPGGGPSEAGHPGGGDRVPSHHGGFLGGEFGYAGQPEAFARRLRDVLDDSAQADATRNTSDPTASRRNATGAAISQ